MQDKDCLRADMTHFSLTPADSLTPFRTKAVSDLCTDSASGDESEARKEKTCPLLLTLAFSSMLGTLPLGEESLLVRSMITIGS